MGVEDAYGFERCFVALLVHAPDVYIALEESQLKES